MSDRQDVAHIRLTTEARKKLKLFTVEHDVTYTEAIELLLKHYNQSKE